MTDFVFLIHGGAGVISKTIESEPYVSALKRIIQDSFNFAKNANVSAVDIVEFAVIQLENEPLFNAGKGSVYTEDGRHELEASIMDGTTLSCGSTSLITTVKNPISVARLVMDKTKHNYIIGENAVRLAENAGLAMVRNDYYDTEKRYNQLKIAKSADLVKRDHDIDVPNSTDEGGDLKKGTVGCVCMKSGHVAAATSTGGMTNKMSGRIGDTPIIGAGTYANDKTCAVSGTGIGEIFMSCVAAYDVSARIEFTNASLKDAVKGTVFHKLPIGSGGIIAVNSNGNYAMESNCGGMFRGACSSDGLGSIGIWEDDYPCNFNDKL